MAIVSVSSLKQRFKKGMYPTEDDFANVFDSYVHKSDGIDIGNVSAENGTKTLAEVLSDLKDEVVEEAVTTAKDEASNDVDTKLAGYATSAAVNAIDGRVTTLENAEPATYTAGEGISIEDGVISATGGGGDGMTYIPRIDDLDESDAPVGTIALYGGETTSQYTHGRFYEKVEMQNVGHPTRFVGGLYPLDGTVELCSPLETKTVYDSDYATTIAKALLTRSDGTSMYIGVGLDEDNNVDSWDGTSSNITYYYLITKSGSSIAHWEDVTDGASNRVGISYGFFDTEVEHPTSFSSPYDTVSLITPVETKTITDLYGRTFNVAKAQYTNQWNNYETGIVVDSSNMPIYQDMTGACKYIGCAQEYDSPGKMLAWDDISSNDIVSLTGIAFQVEEPIFWQPLDVCGHTGD